MGRTKQPVQGPRVSEPASQPLAGTSTVSRDPRSQGAQDAKTPRFPGASDSRGPRALGGLDTRDPRSSGASAAAQKLPNPAVAIGQPFPVLNFAPVAKAAAGPVAKQLGVAGVGVSGAINGPSPLYRPPFLGLQAAGAAGVAVFRPQPGIKPAVKAQPPGILASRPPVTSSFAVLNPGPNQPMSRPALPSLQQLAKLPQQHPRVKQAAATTTASGSTTASDSEDSGEADEEAGAVVDPEDPEWGSRKRRRASQPSSQNRPIPIIPGGPPGERRANRLWRHHLNNELLKTALQNVKRKVGHSKAYPFLTQVELDVAPDYHNFVKPQDEMWLHQISNKLRGLAYSERSQFIADFATIRDNCLAYNSPGCGQFGGPTLVGWAEELVAASRQEIESMSDSLAKAEAAIKDPECQPPYKEPVLEKVATAQRVISHVPLPIGFRHTLRLTSSKPQGWVQYEAMCPVHNCTRTADRIAKLADIFKSHSQCREEWKQYGQRPEEAQGDYQERLRETFNFQKGAPPNTTSTRLNLIPTAQAQSPAIASPAAAAASSRSQPTLATAAVLLPNLTRALPAQRPAAAVPQAQQPAAHVQPPIPQTEPPPSYQNAFKRVEEPLRPAFDPPRTAVSWPTRTTSAGTSSGAEGDVSRKRKPEQIPTSAADTGKDVNGDMPAAKRQATGAALSVGVPTRQNVGATPVDAFAEARRRLQLETERYRQETAGHQTPQLSNEAGLADQSWGSERDHRSAAASGEEPANGHARAALPEGGGPSSVDGGDREPFAEWDGTGLFPRKREEFYLRSKVACVAPSSVLLLTGPPMSGKSALLEQMRNWWSEEESKLAAEKSAAPWLQFDCRTAAASASHFAGVLKSAVAEFAHRKGAAAELPLIRDQDHRGYIKPEDWTPSRSGGEDLSRCLDSLSRWWVDLKKQGQRTACLVLDSAHKLKETGWAKQLLNGLEQFSSQGVHIVLASSDSTFQSWLADMGVSAEVETVGELPREAARRYFQGLLKGNPAPVDLGKDWDEIWRVCGGNSGLLKLCLHSSASYGKLDSALKSIWREAGAKVRQGLELRLKGSYTKENYSVAVGTILESPFRAVSATDVENRLGADGREALHSLAAAGLLMLREPSELASDIPLAAYGPLQDRLVTLPSAAHAYFWSLLSKASVDALSCGVY